MAATSGNQPAGCGDSKEVRMAWQISAAANAVIGIACLAIAHIIIGGLVRTEQAGGDAST
jgi:hypothetical protein